MGFFNENPEPDAPERAARPGQLAPDAAITDVLADAAWGAVRDQATAYRYARLRDNSVARRIARETAYDELQDEVYRLTGQRVLDGANPIREAYGLDINPATGRFFMDPLAQGLDDEFGQSQTIERRWRAALAEMIQADPRLTPLMPRLTQEAMELRAEELRDQATRDFHLYLGNGGFGEQLWRSILVMPGLLAGGISSGAPEQVAQLGAGGARALPGSGLGERLAVSAGGGAFANVVGQAAVEPFVIEDARRMGEEYTATQVWLDFLVAAGIGGGIGAVGGIAPDGRSTPIERARPIVRDIVNEAPSERDLTDLSAAGAGEAVREATAGTAESLIVGAVQRDAVTADIVRNAPLDNDAAVDAIIAAERFLLGDRDEPQVTVERTRQAEPAEIEAARRQADETPPPAEGTREMVRMNGQDRPRTFERFRPGDIGFDPETFQYKRSEGPQGSTGRLAGVERWDGQSAGKVVVFESRDGTLTIADGHQRLGLAQRLSRAGQEIMLDGYRYREADGWTAREVRDLAAQKNIREGSGDVLDTARLIREAPELIDSSIPQRGAEFRRAQSLARLSDGAFRAVVAGRLEPHIAAAIAEAAPDRPDVHDGLVDLFIRNPPRSAREAAFIAREATMAAVVRQEAAQISMFGDDLVISGMQERAAILTQAGRILREDKRAFATATRYAEDLQAAGNVLATEANQRRVDAANALINQIDVLATRPGPVATLLRDIAARAAENKTSAKAAGQEFVDRLVQMLEERGLRGLLTDEAPPRAPAPERIEQPDLEAQARAATLREAHDLDEEAFQQARAEVALERALAGEIGDVIPEDAIGRQTEADLMRIEDAAEALGVEPDFSELQVAAAILARGGDDLDTTARERLAPEEINQPRETEPAPELFADAAEMDAEIEAPWMPGDFDDVEKLRQKIAEATLPELEAIAREMNMGDTARTRAEYERLFTRPRGVRFSTVAPSPEPLSTVGAGQAELRQAFPRLANKLTERGRLNIVQSVNEIPDAAINGMFAFDNARTAEQRKPLADSLLHLRTSMGRGMGFSDYYAWEGAVETMAAEIVQSKPGAPAVVSFGNLGWGGVGFGRVGGDLANARETLSRAMAVIDRDVAENGRELYSFTGFDDKLKRAYQTLTRIVEPPAGYKVGLLRNGVIVVVRQDVLDAAGGDFQRAFSDSVPMSGSVPKDLADQMDTLAKTREDDLDELARKAREAAGRTSRADRGAVMGYAVDGRAWLVADNTPDGAWRGLTLHEVGVHVGMPEMLGERGFNELLSEVERLRAEGDADILAGYTRAQQAGTRAAVMPEEALAYAIQYADPDTMSTGLRGLITRVVNSVRAWMWRTFPGLRTNWRLTFDDMRYLAMGALRHASQNDPRNVVFMDSRLAVRQRDTTAPLRGTGEVTEPGRFWDDRLTDQQNQVARWAMTGRNSRQIADAILEESGDVVSENLVNVALTNIRKRAPEVAEQFGSALRGRPPSQDGMTARVMAMLDEYEAQGRGGRGVVALIAERLNLEPQQVQYAITNGRARRRRTMAPEPPSRTIREDARSMQRIVQVLKDCK